MMIRSSRIPAALDRICGSGDILTHALLVTADGELLGCSSDSPKNTSSSFGTLVADIAADYVRLGEEYATADPQRKDGGGSHMQCLLIEMDLGLVAVADCQGIDCFVIAVAKPDAPLGLVKARLQAMALHFQESLSTVTEAT